MVNEVRYERLRPPQIQTARQACPVLYIPIGALEWHGLHNVVGLDTLKAHELCIRCAQAGGGLVFPPMYFGENRLAGLMEINARDHDQIIAGYGLTPAHFSPEAFSRTANQQDDDYARLLVHLLFQGQSLGFEVVVFCAGHYPLLDFARAACHLFHQKWYQRRRIHCIPWAFTGYELVKDEFPAAGDHAAWWETSLMMHLCPDLVDLSQLPQDPNNWIGVAGVRGPNEANAQDGARGTQLIITRVLEKVNDRLKNPGHYHGHGLRLET